MKAKKKLSGKSKKKSSKKSKGVVRTENLDGEVSVEVKEICI